LNNLTYFLREFPCQKGQVVYRQDKDLIDRVYFVKSGEFEVLKTFEI